MVRSILSVIAGYVTWTVVFLGAGAAIRAINPAAHDASGNTGDTSVLVLYLVMSVVASVLAGLVTAKIAPKKTMLHVLILGLALLATGIPVQLSTWDSLPIWYNLIFLVLLVPMALAGGRIGAARAPQIS